MENNLLLFDRAPDVGKFTGQANQPFISILWRIRSQ